MRRNLIVALVLVGAGLAAAAWRPELSGTLFVAAWLATLPGERAPCRTSRSFSA